MADAVCVFLDWQNVYMRARESFHSSGADFTCGQIDPVDLGEILASRGVPGADRKLTQVRIYRGVPDQARDAHAYAAARRQIAAWEKDTRVKVYPRLLKYPDQWVAGAKNIQAPREKGVDVALAVDLVTCGLEGVYDTGIVMSSDNDLLPALEYLDRRQKTRGKPRLEVAAWRGDQGRRPNRITVGNGRPFCHWLSQEDYWGVQDTRDYTHASPGDMGSRR